MCPPPRNKVKFSIQNSWNTKICCEGRELKEPEETNGDNQKTLLLVTVKFSYR